MGKNISITIDNWCAKVDGDVPKEVVIDATSYLKTNVQHSTLYKKKLWDGRTKLFDKRRETFPAGLCFVVKEKIEKWAARNEIDVDVSIKRKPPPEPLGDTLELKGIRLREYQKEAAEALLKAGMGILQAATGSGKTETAAAVIQYIGRKTLFFVPSRDLLHQTADRLKTRLGVEIGMIGDDNFDVKDITVVLVPAAAKFYSNSKSKNNKPIRDVLRSAEVLVIDECHRIAAKTFYKMTKHCNAPYRFAMSGTPLDRADGANLAVIAMGGPVVYEITNEDLKDLGFLVPAEIAFHHISDPKPDSDDYDKPYVDLYTKFIVKNYQRNHKIINQTIDYYNKDCVVLILVERIEHGNILSNMLWGKKDFLPHEFISGKEPTTERKMILEDLRSGLLRIVIATRIFAEGIDVPIIDVIIPAGGEKAKIKTLQRIGRGLRKGNKLGKLVVVEFFDKMHPIFKKHSVTRYRDYLDENCFDLKEVR